MELRVLGAGKYQGFLGAIALLSSNVLVLDTAHEARISYPRFLADLDTHS